MAAEVVNIHVHKYIMQSSPATKHNDSGWRWHISRIYIYGA